MSLIEEIFFSWTRIHGSSSTHRPSSVDVGHEVRRQVALVELHALDPLDVVSRLLPSSTVITPSLPTRSIASARILPISSSLLAAIEPTWAISFLPLTGVERPLRSFDGGVHGLLDAALDRHRIRAGGDVAQALFEDRLGQNGRGRRAVARDVGRLRGHFLHELGAHVFVLALELDFLGHRDAVLGDGRAAEGLLDDDIAAAWAESDLDCACELTDTVAHALASFLVVCDLLDCHVILFRCLELN